MIEAQQRSRPVEFYSERDSLQEKCGIAGIISKIGQNVSPELIDILQFLENRGKDSTGIAAYNPITGKIESCRGKGVAKEVFGHLDFESVGILSTIAAGHTRYTTEKGDLGLSTAPHPIVVEDGTWKLALSHNGNIPDELRKRLQAKVPPRLRLGPDLDSADITRAIVASPGANWVEKIGNALEDVPLAYSLVMITGDREMYGLSGPTDMWPLWIGENDDMVVLSSEDSAGRHLNLNWRKVEPGELVKVTPKGVESIQLFDPKFRLRCGFNDHYFARAESTMGYLPPIEVEVGETEVDGKKIRIMEEKSEPYTYEQFRYEAGRILSEENQILDADIYVGVPNSGVPIAEGYCDALGLTPTNIFKKTKDRSYISATNDDAKKIAKQKLQLLPNADVRGKRIVAFEDSTITGNMATVMTDLLYEAGAAEVIIMTTLERVTGDCDQGGVMRKEKHVALEVDANGHERIRFHQEIADKVGATGFRTLTSEGTNKLYESAGYKSHELCYGCMNRTHPLQRPEIIKEIFVANRPQKVDIAA